MGGEKNTTIQTQIHEAWEELLQFEGTYNLYTPGSYLTNVAKSLDIYYGMVLISIKLSSKILYRM